MGLSTLPVLLESTDASDLRCLERLLALLPWRLDTLVRDSLWESPFTLAVP
eukprot:XP_001706419.1 Hypothetical protein GL50803_23894 [Giardia lamblia ATCC 50803]